jgi:hypothetical protein
MNNLCIRSIFSLIGSAVFLSVYIFHRIVVFFQQTLYALHPGFNPRPDIHEKLLLSVSPWPKSTTYNLDVYQQRNPKASAYYKCVENHFEALEQA